MYYYLKGRVTMIINGLVILEVGGIGYAINVLHEEHYKIGDEVMIFVNHIVREDEEYLVGFETLQEKEVYNLLLTVKGIGPKMALNALKSISIERFLDIVKRGDLIALKKLPGIGPKAASQIILDLKGTLMMQPEKKTTLNPNKELAKDALINLGFKPRDLDEALKNLEEDLSVEEYVSKALKQMRK